MEWPEQTKPYYRYVQMGNLLWCGILVCTPALARPEAATIPPPSLAALVRGERMHVGSRFDYKPQLLCSSPLQATADCAFGTESLRERGTR